LASSAKRAQNGAGKNRVLNANFFVAKITHRFTHFPAADFREILTQNMNWRRHKNFGNII